MRSRWREVSDAFACDLQGPDGMSMTRVEIVIDNFPIRNTNSYLSCMSNRRRNRAPHSTWMDSAAG